MNTVTPNLATRLEAARRASPPPAAAQSTAGGGAAPLDEDDFSRHLRQQGADPAPGLRARNSVPVAAKPADPGEEPRSVRKAVAADSPSADGKTLPPDVPPVALPVPPPLTPAVIPTARPVVSMPAATSGPAPVAGPDRGQGPNTLTLPEAAVPSPAAAPSAAGGETAGPGATVDAIGGPAGTTPTPPTPPMPSAPPAPPAPAPLARVSEGQTPVAARSPGTSPTRDSADVALPAAVRVSAPASSAQSDVAAPGPTRSGPVHSATAHPAPATFAAPGAGPAAVAAPSEAPAAVPVTALPPPTVPAPVPVAVAPAAAAPAPPATDAPSGTEDQDNADVTLREAPRPSRALSASVRERALPTAVKEPGDEEVAPARASARTLARRGGETEVPTGLSFAVPIPGQEPAAAPQGLPSAPAVSVPLDAPDWGQKLAESVGWAVNQKLTHAQISLNPDHLGPLEIRLSLAGNQATVWFGTHSHAAADALAASSGHLRSLLGQAGFAQVNVDVSRQSGQQSAFAGSSYRSGRSAAEAALPAVGDPVSAARPAPRSVLDAYA